MNIRLFTGIVEERGLLPTFAIRAGQLKMLDSPETNDFAAIAAPARLMGEIFTCYALTLAASSAKKMKDKR